VRTDNGSRGTGSENSESKHANDDFHGFQPFEKILKIAVDFLQQFRV
jgi:hypothetical protein